MYQQVTLVGNVGNDAEVRYTPNGVPVANFSVAVNRKWGDGQEKTVWFRVTAWRKTAEVVGEYVKKGMKVLVTGEIEEPRIYTNKNGEQAVSLDITAQTVKFLSSRNEDGRGSSGGGGQQESVSNYDDTEDIPF